MGPLWLSCIVVVLCGVLGEAARSEDIVNATSASVGTRRRLVQLRGAQDAAVRYGDAYIDAKFRHNVPVSNITVPLFAHSGVHHVQVYVGSPPQQQTLIVDTGSRLMSFSCKSCRTCGRHANAHFDSKLSSTVVEAKCGDCQLAGISSCGVVDDRCVIQQKYTEGSSWSAYEMEDMVWLGTADVTASLEDYMQTAVPYSFGCQTATTGLFQKQYADGILGLAQHPKSLFKNLASAKVIQKNAFSLYLTREGGQLSLGGTHPHVIRTKPMALVPLYREQGFFSIEVVAVYVGHEPIVSRDDELSLHMLNAFNSGKGTILDTGTTDTYFPSAVGGIMKAATVRAMSKTSINARELFGRQPSQLFTYDDVRQFPSVTVVFENGASLVLQPKNFLEGVPLNEHNGDVVPWSGTRTLTNRLYVSEAEGAVLGANALFNYEVYYDSQSRQVGIAPANCYSLQSTFHIGAAEFISG